MPSLTDLMNQNAQLEVMANPTKFSNAFGEELDPKKIKEMQDYFNRMLEAQEVAPQDVIEPSRDIARAKEVEFLPPPDFKNLTRSLTSSDSAELAEYKTALKDQLSNLASRKENILSQIPRGIDKGKLLQWAGKQWGVDLAPALSEKEEFEASVGVEKETEQRKLDILKQLLGASQETFLEQLKSQGKAARAQQITDLQKKDLNAFRTVAAEAESIKRNFNAKFTGIFNPKVLASSVSILKSTGLVGPELAAFKADISDIINQYVKAITGAQMSDNEAKRIMAAVPAITDTPSEFLAKLNSFQQRVVQRHNVYVNTLMATRGSLEDYAKYGITPYVPENKKDKEAREKTLSEGRPASPEFKIDFSGFKPDEGQ